MQPMRAHLWLSSSKALQQMEILRQRLLGPGSAAERGRMGSQGIQGVASWVISTKFLVGVGAPLGKQQQQQPITINLRHDTSLCLHGSHFEGWTEGRFALMQALYYKGICRSVCRCPRCKIGSNYNY